jgi:hypothetical protein
MRQEFILPDLENLPDVLSLAVQGAIPDFPGVERVRTLARQFAATALREYCACHPRQPVKMAVERTGSTARLEVTYTCMPHPCAPELLADRQPAYVESLQLIREAADGYGLDSWNGIKAAQSQTWWALVNEALYA